MDAIKNTQMHKEQDSSQNDSGLVPDKKSLNLNGI
jgi:hypothetical protein